MMRSDSQCNYKYRSIYYERKLYEQRRGRCTAARTALPSRMCNKYISQKFSLTRCNVLTITITFLSGRPTPLALLHPHWERSCAWRPWREAVNSNMKLILTQESKRNIMCLQTTTRWGLVYVRCAHWVRRLQNRKCKSKCKWKLVIYVRNRTQPRSSSTKASANDK